MLSRFRRTAPKNNASNPMKLTTAADAKKMRDENALAKKRLTNASRTPPTSALGRMLPFGRTPEKRAKNVKNLAIRANRGAVANNKPGNNNRFKLNFSANGAPRTMANSTKRDGALARFRKAGATVRKTNPFVRATGNARLRSFAGAKGITNLRAYNKSTVTNQNLLAKNRVMYFNNRNKKPILAFVPMKLRDSNVSAIGKILGREYVFQNKGPMGPGHYNKQFVQQLAAVVPGGGGPIVPFKPSNNKPNTPPGPIVPFKPNTPPGPIVPFKPSNNKPNTPPGPIVPFKPSNTPIIEFPSNNLNKKCAQLMREKERIEEQMRKLGCRVNSKNF
jgi:hypothetical protein